MATTTPFEEIETIEDVLPFVDFEHGIIHSDHGQYSVINYVFTDEETFSTAMRLECRGLKFAPDGRIIARPFHKFFNLGEREQIQDIDWQQRHAVLEKLDGSLIHPALLDGELVFMTRMGVTYQSRQALAFAGDAERSCCTTLMARDMTPMFEFTSPDNRIVVDYQDTRLTLLAVRHMNTGAYLTADALQEVADEFGVELVEHHDAIDDARSFHKAARAREGGEGFVIAFDDGHRLKVKSDGYVLRHKALSGLAHEKNVLMWVVTDSVDDVVPLVAPEIGERILRYQSEVHGLVDQHLGKIESLLEENRHLERRDLAQKVFQSLDKRLTGVAFSIADGKDGRTQMLRWLKQAAGSETKVAAVRDLFPVSWDASDIANPDIDR